MKNFLTFLFINLISFIALAQPPQKFSFQGVIRNAGNQLLTNQQVNMKISIIQGSANGTAVYSELHSPITNDNGLATLEIGGGMPLNGNFSNINWASGPYFIKSETDLNGGNNYTVTSTQQLLSVPFALYSSSANFATTANNGVPAGGSNGQILTNCNGVAMWTTAGQCPGTIDSLICEGATINGILTSNQPAEGVYINVQYTGGGGGVYNSQMVSSTGVTGLTANLAEGNLANGAGNLTYNVSGIPDSTGTASFAVNIGGQNCTLTLTVYSGGSNLLNIETELIPAGTFVMGSPSSESQGNSDEVQHQVILSTFRIGKYEINNEQYAVFLNANNIDSTGIYPTGSFPSQVLIYQDASLGLIWSDSHWQPAEGKNNFPIVNVNWYGAYEFAAYAGGRLPTEAEWEYACRGGTTTVFNTGNCLDYTQANYHWNNPYIDCSNAYTNNPIQTYPVNSYNPNSYGLFNMHGNVLEYCADWYGTYPTIPQINPTGPSTGEIRIVRGGSWLSGAENCRSADRILDPPNGGNVAIGFRLVFAP